MKIELLSVGVRAPRWVQAGFDEYATRLPSSWTLALKEIQPAIRGKSGNIDVFRRHEAEALIASVKPGHRLIALDLKGRSLSTAQLASRLDSNPPGLQPMPSMGPLPPLPLRWRYVVLGWGGVGACLVLRGKFSLLLCSWFSDRGI